MQRTQPPSTSSPPLPPQPSPAPCRQQVPQWNIALADALLHTVREAPLGCELLMAALARVVADQKAAAASPSSAGQDGAGAGGHFHGQNPSRSDLSGGGGGGPAGASSSAGSADDATLGGCRSVMRMYHVGLQWALQCGSSDASMGSVVELADCVLTAVLQPLPPGGGPGPGTAGPSAGSSGHFAPAAGGTSPSLFIRGGGGSGIAGVGPGSVGSRLGAAGASSSVAGSGHLQHHSGLPPHPHHHGHHPHQQQASPFPFHSLASHNTPGGGGGAGADAAAAAADAAGGSLVAAQQLLAGRAAFDPDILACTPPELLVSLLQQCSQAEPGQPDGSGGAVAGGGGTATASGALRKGFLGRPGAATAGGEAGSGAGAAGALHTTSQQQQQVAASQPGSAAAGPWQDLWQVRGGRGGVWGGGDGDRTGGRGGGLLLYHVVCSGRLPCRASRPRQHCIMAASQASRQGCQPGYSQAARAACHIAEALPGLRLCAPRLCARRLASCHSANTTTPPKPTCTRTFTHLHAHARHTQDRRLALLLALMARCSLDPEAFSRYSLSHVIKAQLACHDLRCRYYAGAGVRGARAREGRRGQPSQTHRVVAAAGQAAPWPWPCLVRLCDPRCAAPCLALYTAQPGTRLPRPASLAPSRTASPTPPPRPTPAGLPC